MLTVQYARAVPEVKFNAVEPGYTATELGGSENSQGRPVEISARTIVRMAIIDTRRPHRHLPGGRRRTRLVAPRAWRRLPQPAQAAQPSTNKPRSGPPRRSERREI